MVVLSGFGYDAGRALLVAAPLVAEPNFQCFWSTGTGWGTFSLRRQGGGTVFAFKVLAGTLACRSCEIAAPGTAAHVQSGGRVVENQVARKDERMVVTLGQTVRLDARDKTRDEIAIEVRG